MSIPWCAEAGVSVRVRSAMAAAAAGNRPRRDHIAAEVTSFVGRRDDIAKVRLLLRSSRLVTLTGVGGTEFRETGGQFRRISRPASVS